LPFGNEQKGDKENRPRESLFQGKTHFSDGTDLAINNEITLEKKTTPKTNQYETDCLFEEISGHFFGNQQPERICCSQNRSERTDL
jgi:hypothetical protein